MLEASLAFSVAAVGFTACGQERSPTVPRFSPPVDTCAASDGPVGAFWGSDEGVGWPGRGPESPEGGDVWSITVDGQVQPITDDARSRDPSISDDGRRLYFNRSAGGTVAGAAAPGTEAWVHDLTTGEQTMLFALDDPQFESVTRLAESPDGTTIAYSAAVGDPSSARERIYLIDRVDARSPRPLPVPESDLFNGQVEPTWSPDGTMLAYLDYEIDELQNSSWSVRMVELESSKPRLVYEYADPSRLRGLHWSPDARSLLVTEESIQPSDESPRIGNVAVSIDAASGERTVLTDDVVLEVTYFAAGGETIGEIGSPLGAADTLQDPVLSTWDRAADEVTADTTALSASLSFASSLSIAACALGR